MNDWTLPEEVYPSTWRGCGSKTLLCNYDPGSKFCSVHGPAVRKAKAAKPIGLVSGWGNQPGLTVIPEHAGYREVMRSCNSLPEPDEIKRRVVLAYRRRKRDTWTAALAKAFNVEIGLKCARQECGAIFNGKPGGSSFCSAACKRADAAKWEAMLKDRETA